MRFKEIIGHHTTKKHLINTVHENRVSHAQMFLGSEGSGNLALAVAYAQYINCLDRDDEDSCGKCSSCRKYDKLIHPDLHFSYPFFASKGSDVATLFIDFWRKAFLENPYLSLSSWRNQLDAANKQANINIAEVHDIIKKLSLKSFEAEYKACIIWLPEYLDVQGNALLKLIEEPPEKTLFIFVAENEDKILNTIISRTQLVKIKKPNLEEVTSFLVDQKSLDINVAQQIALMADGNIQAALNLWKESDSEVFELMITWLRNIVTDSGLNLINSSEPSFTKLGREGQKNFLFYTINMFRQIVLKSQGLDQLVLLKGKELEFITKFSENYTLEQLEATIKQLEEKHYAIERNANPKLLFLDLSLQLVLLFKYKTFARYADSIYI